jgi:triosephosphate isomerase (TIM)
MKLIVANWKLYLGVKEAAHLAEQIRTALPRPRAKVVVCPSAPALFLVGSVLRRGSYALGAQDVGIASQGPHTGQVSPKDLRTLGCTHAIVGHSERRQQLGESDTVVRQKLEAAVAAGLHPILCVGETKQERRTGKAKTVVRRQLTSALRGLKPKTISIAYEPIWAIGSGTTAALHDVVTMHKYIRTQAKTVLPRGTKLAILYGGSVDRKTLMPFLGEHEIDGVLVGGASSKRSFIDMLRQVR